MEDRRAFARYVRVRASLHDGGARGCQLSKATEPVRIFQGTLPISLAREGLLTVIGASIDPDPDHDVYRVLHGTYASR